MTTYTVFCAEQAPTCRIAGDLPFVFTEGSESLKYGGTASSVMFVSLLLELRPVAVFTHARTYDCLSRKEDDLTRRKCIQNSRPALRPGRNDSRRLHRVVHVRAQLHARHAVGADADELGQDVPRGRGDVGPADAGDARPGSGHHRH